MFLLILLLGIQILELVIPEILTFELHPDQPNLIEFVQPIIIIFTELDTELLTNDLKINSLQLS